MLFNLILCLNWITVSNESHSNVNGNKTTKVEKKYILTLKIKHIGGILDPTKNKRKPKISNFRKVQTKLRFKYTETILQDFIVIELQTIRQLLDQDELGTLHENS